MGRLICSSEDLLFFSFLFSSRLPSSPLVMNEKKQTNKQKNKKELTT